MSNDAFTEAQKVGGKHHGFYLHYRNEPRFFIVRGIRSLEWKIAEHEEKLRNPDSVPGFTEADPREQEALVNRYWPEELATFREQKAILQGILEQRNERSS